MERRMAVDQPKQMSQQGGSVKEPRYVTFIDKDGKPGKVINGQPIPEGASMLF